jgi:hypothetical protein
MEIVLTFGVILLIMGFWRLFVELSIKAATVLPIENDPCGNDNIKPRKPQDYL